MDEREKKASKRNIIIMVVLAVMFIIGIVTRWEYTKKEVVSSVKNYIIDPDSINNKK